jgi:hypothetical protein
MHGMNLRTARRIWVDLGGIVYDRRRSGEEVYTHPLIARPITVNKRRKDAPRELTAAISRIESARLSLVR